MFVQESERLRGSSYEYEVVDCRAIGESELAIVVGQQVGASRTKPKPAAAAKG